jgi:hypothetical protein
MPHPLREKARMRVYNTLTVHGDEWPRLLGVCAPNLCWLFLQKKARPLVGILHVFCEYPIKGTSYSRQR